MNRETHAITDRNGRVISVLAGRPRRDNWDGLVEELANKISAVREQTKFSNKQLNHKRGEFPSVAFGTSFGGGSLVSILRCSWRTTCLLFS